MTIGLALFIAADTLGALGAVISCRRTSRDRGRGAAAREAAVLGVSLGAYTAACLTAGFGFWPQLAGCLLSAAVVAAGWHWVPSVAEYLKGDN
jgi:hypothetical protein